MDRHSAWPLLSGSDRATPIGRHIVPWRLGDLGKVAAGMFPKWGYDEMWFIELNSRSLKISEPLCTHPVEGQRWLPPLTYPLYVRVGKRWEVRGWWEWKGVWKQVQGRNVLDGVVVRGLQPLTTIFNSDFSLSSSTQRTATSTLRKLLEIHMFSTFMALTNIRFMFAETNHFFSSITWIYLEIKEFTSSELSMLWEN